MEHVNAFVEPLTEFAKSSQQLLNKCTKPDRSGSFCKRLAFVFPGALGRRCSEQTCPGSHPSHPSLSLQSSARLPSPRRLALPSWASSATLSSWSTSPSTTSLCTCASATPLFLLVLGVVSILMAALPCQVLSYGSVARRRITRMSIKLTRPYSSTLSSTVGGCAIVPSPFLRVRRDRAPKRGPAKHAMAVETTSAPRHIIIGGGFKLRVLSSSGEGEPCARKRKKGSEDRTHVPHSCCAEDCGRGQPRCEQTASRKRARARHLVSLSPRCPPRGRPLRLPPTRKNRSKKHPANQGETNWQTASFLPDLGNALHQLAGGHLFGLLQQATGRLEQALRTITPPCETMRQSNPSRMHAVAPGRTSLSLSMLLSMVSSCWVRVGCNNRRKT